jgi:hypothetical protein
MGGLMNYIPTPQQNRFHQAKEMIRVLNGPIASGKTTAAIMEICGILPDKLYMYFAIKETRWVILSMNGFLPQIVMGLFPEATWNRSRGEIVISRTGGIETTLRFFSGRAENTGYTMPKWQDGKRHKKLTWLYPKLLCQEMTGYFIESADQMDLAIRTLNCRIGRFPMKCPVRYAIIESMNPVLADCKDRSNIWESV